MECPICFNIINNSCVGSCMHHYCYACLMKWISFSCVCPTCKKPILEIKLDREFDSINNPDCSILLEEVTKKVEIFFNDDIPPGITISTNKSGPGIKITKLNKNDKCYQCGLRVGDIILFINSIPCFTHEQSIKIIKTLFETQSKLICELMIIKK